MNLYEAIKATGAKMDNHYSDLYAEATPEVMRLVKESGYKFSTFISNIEGTLWVDVPFQFQPYWDEKQKVR